MENQTFYEELIEGKQKVKNATEAVIARTSKNAGMVLAYIGLHHPATEIVFKYFVSQNYPDLKQRLLHPTKFLAQGNDAETLEILFQCKRKS